MIQAEVIRDDEARGERVLRALHEGLTSRELPETVAARLAEHPVIASDAPVAGLLRARARSRRHRSSMPETWFEPVDLRRKIAVAQALFAEEIATANDPRAVVDPVEKDPRRVALFVVYLSEQLAKRPGRSSFLHERLGRADRVALTGLSKHAYNKRFRLLNRMSDHLAQYRRERRFLGYRVVGKAGLVADVEWKEFAREPWSAAFAAYHAARRRRRSAFTTGPQDGAFDDLCAALLARARRGRPNWMLIARVLPEREAVDNLTDEERGRLLGLWLMTLRDVADDLERLWRGSAIDLATMVVKRGDDSSSWNLAAQAWNAARTGWLAAQEAMGMGTVVDRFLPGKVLRLMAGDVAWNHRVVGGGLHPDTRVWAELPFPWDVMRGRASCDRASIEAACRRHGLDPVRTGWTAPLVSTRAVPYKATPELVHGVEVASPEIAAVLRRAGWFSGK